LQGVIVLAVAVSSVWVNRRASSRPERGIAEKAPT
jgi:hypothetical protein